MIKTKYNSCFASGIHINEMLLKEYNKQDISYVKIAIFNSMKKKLNFNYQIYNKEYTYTYERN